MRRRRETPAPDLSSSRGTFLLLTARVRGTSPLFLPVLFLWTRSLSFSRPPGTPHRLDDSRPRHCRKLTRVARLSAPRARRWTNSEHDGGYRCIKSIQACPLELDARPSSSTRAEERFGDRAESAEHLGGRHVLRRPGDGRPERTCHVASDEKIAGSILAAVRRHVSISCTT